jgi:hypothetical protein
MATFNWDKEQYQSLLKELCENVTQVMSLKALVKVVILGD